MDNKLWGLYTPGPDEYHAMPDRQTAERIAAKYNAVITEWHAEQSKEKARYMEPLASCLMEVCEWPGNAENHAAHWAETKGAWKKPAGADGDN